MSFAVIFLRDLWFEVSGIGPLDSPQLMGKRWTNPPRKVGRQDTLAQTRLQQALRTYQIDGALPIAARWWYERLPCLVSEELDVDRGEYVDQMTPWNHRHRHRPSEFAVVAAVVEESAPWSHRLQFFRRQHELTR
jgi:hypothetical protein